MALTFTQRSYAGRLSGTYREPRVLPIGYKPTVTLPLGITILRGTPIYYDYANAQVTIMGAGKVYEAATSSKTIKVAKGSYFFVGQTVANSSATTADAGSAVTDVDYSNLEYNTITLTTAITVAKGDIMVVKDQHKPNAVVGYDHEVKDANNLISVAYQAVVIDNAIGTEILSGWKTGFVFTDNHNIVLTKQ